MRTSVDLSTTLPPQEASSMLFLIELITKNEKKIKKKKVQKRKAKKYSKKKSKKNFQKRKAKSPKRKN